MRLFLKICFMFFLVMPAYANTVKVVASVNGNAITDADINNRIALLKLQHQSGDLAALAKTQLIEEKLKYLEAKKHNCLPSESEISKSFKDFANKNGMNSAQFSLLLDNSGINPIHFKDYMAAQMAWQNLVIMRYRAEHSGSKDLPSQDIINLRLKKEGTIPKAYEYKLQKITFVMPNKPSKKIKDLRMHAVNYFRRNFQGCEHSIEEARPLLDVIVRDIGRYLEPQLPEEWIKVIKKTKVNSVSNPILTKDGYEVFAVCDKRLVSDDRVAQIIYRMKEAKKQSNKVFADLSNKYLSELKSNAIIK